MFAMFRNEKNNIWENICNAEKMTSIQTLKEVEGKRIRGR